MIRQFNSDDALECSEIIRGCVRDDFHLAADVRQYFLEMADPGLLREYAGRFHMAVCECAGRITAVGGVELNEIRLLYVAPGCQHQGTGRLILAYLESLAPPDLFTDVFVYCTQQAQGFYGKCGYHSEGEHEFVLEGIRIPTLFMRKPLRTSLLRIR